VWYLSSTRAAKEIYDFNPNARIIISLRHPVDLLHSLHGRAMLGGDEPVTDFVDAINMSNDERAASTYGLTRRFKYGFNYRNAVDFPAQIKHFLNLFGYDQVHFVLLEDIQTTTAETYQNILKFLDVDPSFKAQFKIVNAHRSVKYHRLLRIIKSQSPLRRHLTNKIPHPIRKKLLNKIFLAVTTDAPRQAIDPEIRRKLTLEHTEKIEHLSKIINRDLSHWMTM